MKENTADYTLAREFLTVTAGFNNGHLKLSILDANILIEVISKAVKMTEEDFVTLLAKEYLNQKNGN